MKEALVVGCVGGEVERLRVERLVNDILNIGMPWSEVASINLSAFTTRKHQQAHAWIGSKVCQTL